jgi:hypothetical protein
VRRAGRARCWLAVVLLAVHLHFTSEATPEGIRSCAHMSCDMFLAGRTVAVDRGRISKTRALECVFATRSLKVVLVVPSEQSLLLCVTSIEADRSEPELSLRVAVQAKSWCSDRGSLSSVGASSQ